jgi:hypothetical protein
VFRSGLDVLQPNDTTKALEFVEGFCQVMPSTSGRKESDIGVDEEDRDGLFG